MLINVYFLQPNHCVLGHDKYEKYCVTLERCAHPPSSIKTTTNYYFPFANKYSLPQISRTYSITSCDPLNRGPKSDHEDKHHHLVSILNLKLVKGLMSL